MCVPRTLICASILLEVSMDFSRKCESKEAKMRQLVSDGSDFTVVFADNSEVKITYPDIDDFVSSRMEEDVDNPVYRALASILYQYDEHVKSCSICQAHAQMQMDYMMGKR